MNRKVWFLICSTIVIVVLFLFFQKLFGSVTSYIKSDTSITSSQTPVTSLIPVIPPLDTVAYDLKLNLIANNPPPKQPTTKLVKDPKTGVTTTVIVPPPPQKPNIWPVKTAYPLPGALLPFNRIVAYYGNLYSKGMGVLGQYPPDQMLAMLEAEVAKWQVADPSTPVIPALQYIAVVAQGSPGADGKYRDRMPDSEIDKVLAMAGEIHGIVFLDVQVGLSNVQTEIPLLEKYLKMPQVHLAIDPEFSIKTDSRPGKVIGTFDASDINFVSNYLANLVRENNLPPKILVVHRFTEAMVTNYKNIETMPEVQIVMNMDGWGVAAKKIDTYKQFIYAEPVQFTGFKLFYKNDTLTPGSTLMTPAELLKLTPQPIYIQYQ